MVGIHSSCDVIKRSCLNPAHPRLLNNQVATCTHYGHCYDACLALTSYQPSQSPVVVNLQTRFGKLKIALHSCGTESNGGGENTLVPGEAAQYLRDGNKCCCSPLASFASVCSIVASCNQHPCVPKEVHAFQDGDMPMSILLRQESTCLNGTNSTLNPSMHATSHASGLLPNIYMSLTSEQTKLWTFGSPSSLDQQCKFGKLQMQS